MANADDSTRAERMRNTLKQGDIPGAERVALAYIEERGDLPESQWYELGFIQTGDDRARVWDRLLEIRAEHWRQLGKPMPPYTRRWC